MGSTYLMFAPTLPSASSFFSMSSGDEVILIDVVIFPKRLQETAILSGNPTVVGIITVVSMGTTA